MKKAQLIVAGIGPGSPEDITPAVIQAVKNSDVVIGYKYYFQFIEPYLEPGTECIDTGMKREKARAEQAFRAGGTRKDCMRYQLGRCRNLWHGSAGLRNEMRAWQPGGNRSIAGYQCFSESGFPVGSTHRSRFLCDFPLRPHDTMGPD